LSGGGLGLLRVIVDDQRRLGEPASVGSFGEHPVLLGIFFLDQPPFQYGKDGFFPHIAQRYAVFARFVHDLGIRDAYYPVSQNGPGKGRRGRRVYLRLGSTGSAQKTQDNDGESLTI